LAQTRRRKDDKETSRQATDVILESISDGVFTVNERWEITSFNRAAEEITGTPRTEAVGRRCCDVFRASICESECALAWTQKTGKPIVDKTIYIVNGQGERIPVSISTALLKEPGGRVIGGVETFRDLSLVEELRKELEGRYVFADIISKNHRMREIFDMIPLVAASDSTILIQGESGTGKELVARALHNMGARAGKPLVVVNCGALPDTLLESELFGYRAGAFTGARTDRKGRFATADGGTVFLDEIADVSPALQVRLLRFLQERTFEPLGGDETVNVDVRIVAATNRDLEGLVAENAFRQDLYYRIAVVKIVIPPLRERRDDIPLLVDHFVSHFNRLAGRRIEGVSAEAMKLIMGHDYPGNVRELENAIEHGVVLCRGKTIRPEHLPDGMKRQGPVNLPTEAPTREAAEAAFLEEALARNNRDRAATARDLGVHRTTLWRMMKRLGVTGKPSQS